MSLRMLADLTTEMVLGTRGRRKGLCPAAVAAVLDRESGTEELVPIRCASA